MTPEESQLKLEKLGGEWSELNCAASLLEDTSKSVLAQLCLNYLPSAKTAARAKLMGEASQDYMEHIKKACEARKLSNISKVNFDAFKVYLDLERTKQATDRAQMSMR